MRHLLSAVLLASLALPFHAQRRPVPPATEPPPRDAVPTVVTGRVLRPDGTAARGAGVTLIERGTPDRPDDGPDLHATAGDDGSFRFELEGTERLHVTLEVSAGGYAQASWWLTRLEPGTRKDLGDLVLEPAGSVSGRVLGSDGRPVADGWKVLVRRDLDPFGDGRGPGWCGAEVDPATGSFHVEGVPPGVLRISAHHELANWIEGPPATLESGGSLSVDIHYRGPDLSRRITVVPAMHYSFFPLVPESAITIRDGEGAALPTRKLPRSANSYVVDGLDPAETYTVRIEHPALRPWVRERVSPGTAVWASLVGNAALRVSVLDEQGSAVPDYSLTARIENVGHTPNSSVLRGWDGTPSSDGRYWGLVPGDYTLSVDVPGRERLELALSGLAADEVRDVVARLPGAATEAIEGIVRAEDGTPLGDVAVALHRPALVADSPASPFETSWISSGDDLRRYRTEHARVRTDRDGRFRFDGLPPGRWIVRARPGPGLEVVRQRDVPTEDAGPIDVRCGPFARVEGRIVGPPGCSWDGLEVRAAGWDAPDCLPDQWVLEEEAVGTAVGPDGSYSVGPLPAGRTRVAVVWWEPGSEGELGKGLTLVERSVELGARETATLDLDLRSDYVGTARIEVRVNGRPAVGYGVSLPGGAFGRTQVDGSATLVVPGGTYRTVVTPPDGRFRHRVSAEVFVPPGGEVRFPVELELAEHELLVQRADSGEPLAWKPLRVLCEGDGHSLLESIVSTDGAGALRLSYPPGTALWIDPDAEEPLGPDRILLVARAGSLPRLQWTRRGPVPPVVAVERVERER